jgi:hypothetical protein
MRILDGSAVQYISGLAAVCLAQLAVEDVEIHADRGAGVVRQHGTGLASTATGRPARALWLTNTNPAKARPGIGLNFATRPNPCERGPGLRSVSLDGFTVEQADKLR